MVKFDSVRMQDLIEVQDPDAEGGFRSIVARMLGEIGTPEAVKAVEEYQSLQ